MKRYLCINSTYLNVVLKDIITKRKPFLKFLLSLLNKALIRRHWPALVKTALENHSIWFIELTIIASPMPLYPVRHVLLQGLLRMHMDGLRLFKYVLSKFLRCLCQIGNSVYPDITSCIACFQFPAVIYHDIVLCVFTVFCASEFQNLGRWSTILYVVFLQVHFIG